MTRLTHAASALAVSLWFAAAVSAVSDYYLS